MRAVVRRALLWAGWRICIAGVLVSACSLVSLDGLADGEDTATGAASASSASTGGLAEGGSGGAGAIGGTGGGGAVAGAGGRGPDGLVGYWPLDDGEGGVAKDAFADHDGFLFGGATWTTGHLGGAVSFEGGRQRIEMPTLFGMAFPTSGTLSLWFLPKFVDVETASRGIFDNYDTQRSHIFARRANEETQMVIQVGMQPAGGAPYVFGAELPVVNSEWQHLVVVWDTEAGVGRVSIGSDVMLKPIEDPTWLPSDQELVLGPTFIGIIDEVRLFDRPLTEAEAASL